MKKFILVIFSLLFLSSISALGISPAKISLNFQPDYQHVFSYTVSNEKPDIKISVLTEGDLAEYTHLNKNKMIGNGNFSLELKLPNKIDKPGKHTIFVVVEENKSQSEVVGEIGRAHV